MTISKNSPLEILSTKPKQISVIQTQRLSQAQAEVLTRVHMAMLVPRDWQAVLGVLLNDCADPEFAAEAVYNRGGTPPVTGLSIRFAERALQVMRNMSVDTAPEQEDEFSALFRTTVVDMESNTPASETFRVSKVTYKREVTDEDFVIEERTDTRGTRYTVECGDEEFAARLGNMRSRIKRNLINGFLPAGVRAACLARCQEVIADQTAKDPQAAAKKLVQEFLAIGIEPSDLKEYLGKSVQSAAESDLVALRGVLTTLREGQYSWDQLLAIRKGAVATKGVKEAFVDQKQKEKEKQKSARGSGAATTPATTPARRPRRTNAQIAADNAAAAAASGKTTTTETETPPAAASTRVSRRDEEDEEDEGDDSPVSTDSSTAAAS